MPDSSLHITQLRCLVERFRAGDLSALDELLRTTHERLERLARKMLRQYPAVKRWEETADLLQNATIRLLHALRDVDPPSVRDFFGLAAEQMRRELLDLARHHHARRMQRLPCAADSEGSNLGGHVPDPPAEAEDHDELEKWCAFHEGVERLPVADREVVGLIYYHGWTQTDVAEHLHMSKRSVQRRWSAATLKLHELLKDL
jgi:RNA polymerase sigma-70 factor (ECF subfamily)